MAKKKTGIAAIAEAAKNNPIKPAVRKRASVAAMICGPVALVGVVGLHLQGATDDPPDPMTGEYITLYDRINDWTIDYATLWLAGTADNAKSLEAMTSGELEVELPDTGYTVNQIRSYVEDSSDGPDNSGIYTMQFRAQVTAPGGQGVEWLTFEMGAAGFHDTFQATTLPYPVNTTRTPYTPTTKYNETGDVDSELGSSLSNFISAYMTPSDSSSSLASTVTPDFDGEPVSSSVWEQVELTGIRYYTDDNSVQVNDAGEGDKIHAIAEVKAVTSSSTWSIVHLPVTVEMQSNGQWSVSDMGGTVDVDGIDTSPGSGEQAEVTEDNEQTQD